MWDRVFELIALEMTDSLRGDYICRNTDPFAIEFAIEKSDNTGCVQRCARRAICPRRYQAQQ